MRAASTFARVAMIALAAATLITSAAHAGLSAEGCQARKLKAQGKFLSCRASEVAKGVQGKPSDVAGCTARFTNTVTQLNAQAVGIECRYRDEGDGTVTDLDTGLQWEKKTNDASVHDVANTYTWTAGSTDPDGTLFTDFLPQFNECQSDDGGTITGGLGGHCDWRLPSIAELRTIQVPFPCGAGPCIDPIFGPTASSIYWSATTYGPNSLAAWAVHFYDVDESFFVYKNIGTLYARAVRGGL